MKKLIIMTLEIIVERRKFVRKKLTIIIMAILLIGTIFIVGGCGSAPPTYRTGEGFEFGFRRYNRGGPVMVAARSSENYFEIDSVTFELSFGWKDRYKDTIFSTESIENTQFENVAIALFLTNQDIELPQEKVVHEVEDFRAIDNFRLLREISLADFNNAKYNIFSKRINSFYSRWVFSYSMPIIISEDILLEYLSQPLVSRGHFIIFISIISFDNSENIYRVVQQSGNFSSTIGMEYEILESGKVRLPRRGGSTHI